MDLLQSIRHNLEFLQTELLGRLQGIRLYLEDTTPEAADKIFLRSDYISNLKQRIHDACYRYIAESESTKSADVLRVRAIDVIATELDRIAELGEEFVQQSLYLVDIDDYNIPRLATQIGLVDEAVADIPTALYENDTQLALRIGRTHDRLERRFRKLVKKNAAALRETSDAQNLLTTSFSAYSIERMGDSLLRISEAIISASLGMVMGTGQFEALQQSILHIRDAGGDEPVRIGSVAETRSGAAISSIRVADGGNGEYAAIFKQGHKKKLKQERKGVERWHDVFPGLAPQIIAWRKKGKSASLLIEHLEGLTFEQVVLNEPTETLNEVLHALKRTLHEVWTETLAEKPVSAGFMRQLERRIGEVYTVHPEFRDAGEVICGRELPSFASLSARAVEIEAGVEAPFSVYIHGDFNIDNILYDPQGGQLHYVDLHRSRYMDYVQDVSVFMVSNYRLQVLDPLIRRRIAGVVCSFYHNIAAEFAKRHGDRGFELRLAFGLVRSLATSTRFILDRDLAKNMFLRARYLLAQIVNLEPSAYDAYRVPVEEIFCG